MISFKLTVLSMWTTTVVGRQPQSLRPHCVFARHGHTYHERECYRDVVNAFNCPESTKEYQLDEGEDVNPVGLHVSQVHVVGLMLGRHEQEQHSVHELQVETDIETESERGTGEHTRCCADPVYVSRRTNLKTVEGRDTHVKKDAVQHSLGNVL